jgi:hypothetical protein
MTTALAVIVMSETDGGLGTGCAGTLHADVVRPSTSAQLLGDWIIYLISNIYRSAMQRDPLFAIKQRASRTSACRGQ